MERHDLAQWCENEFGNVDFGDQRLNERLILLAKRLCEQPLAPINQACEGKAEAKAAYRFFSNPKTLHGNIFETHREHVLERMGSEPRVFLIQDTSFLNFTSHHSTQGLGKIGRYMKGHNKGRGLVMHTSLALDHQGLPLGILAQQLWARPPKPIRNRSKKIWHIPIEKKESFKWLKALRDSLQGISDTQRDRIITIADCEADIFKFMEEILLQKSHLLLRAHVSLDRVIIKPGDKIRSRSGTAVHTLLQELRASPVRGHLDIAIPRRAATTATLEVPARVAHVEVHFEPVKVALPRRTSIRHRKGHKLNPGESERQAVSRALELSAIWIKEVKAPAKAEPLEWLLLTDFPVHTLEEASEKISWYRLRWRIESLHKILKSGCRVEECRLGDAERLKKYLTLFTIIAWRILWMNLLNQKSPDLSCEVVLTKSEWQALYCRVHKTTHPPPRPPTVHEALRWIAGLGGFLGRKCDGEPGITTLWRGWQRLSDIAEDWELFHETEQRYGEQ